MSLLCQPLLTRQSYSLCYKPTFPGQLLAPECLRVSPRPQSMGKEVCRTRISDPESQYFWGSGGQTLNTYFWWFGEEAVIFLWESLSLVLGTTIPMPLLQGIDTSPMLVSGWTNLEAISPNGLWTSSFVHLEDDLCSSPGYLSKDDFDAS